MKALPSESDLGIVVEAQAFIPFAEIDNIGSLQEAFRRVALEHSAEYVVVGAWPSDRETRAKVTG